jgi:hypothetical protein
MSVTRSPRRNAALLTREQQSDGKKVAAWIAISLALASLAFVGGLVISTWGTP